MKINPFQSVHNNPYKKQIEKQAAVEGTKKSDKLEISKEAIEMQKGSRIELEREEKVKQIKEQLASGDYHVDPKKVASKFVDFWVK
ncbi:flagellar biosynthesis anti-sigma factor FlgM [Alkalihalobacillus sp. LMS39]|uniref:flagellar biosynthesis anti-sigma factor FlgM n=1 Tax=Alkalihalobacillus sp. LMS39 TaxID=2924032 RepID=UPI001FB3E5BB|nr:flagellar biosynthesis anti-sigma factor FlgM [Alkalihalobacillus sp. LMS39]UOE93810.1 flagellar biosynthesis anti-sigma factor FlgM [Alkalihalobacillus sp. LMS39]